MILFRRAVLIIHGFAGGTYDEEKLANCLEKKWNLDVYSFTLPSHEKRKVSSVTFKDWVDACDHMVEVLKSYGYRKIYVVGHSMGGVLATYLANKYDCIKKLVLVAPAFEIFARDDYGALDTIKSGIKMIHENDTDEVVSRFMKSSVSAISEFNKLRKKYKSEYKKISIPTLVLQGDKDTVVPPDKSKELFEEINVKNKKLVILKGYTHDVFKKEYDTPIMEIEKFFN